MSALASAKRFPRGKSLTAIWPCTSRLIRKHSSLINRGCSGRLTSQSALSRYRNNYACYEARTCEAGRILFFFIQIAGHRHYGRLKVAKLAPLRHVSSKAFQYPGAFATATSLLVEMITHESRHKCRSHHRNRFIVRFQVIFSAY